jgi:hypothetical protein
LWASARDHLEQAIGRAEDALLDRIAEAEAPFWRHVRDALRDRPQA